MAICIGLQGFTVGADVVQAAGLVGSSQLGDHSVQIVPRRSNLQVAPEGINFEVVLEDFDTTGPVDAVNTYDRKFHEIYYIWDFGDVGSIFTAPQNIPSQHMDGNRAYGPLGSHTYENAGTYTITLTVIEPMSGKSATTTVDVTVGDAEVLFAGDRTIFVSSDPTFARAPTGALTVATGHAAVAQQGALQNANPTQMYRIMFDREVDHLMEKTGQMRDQFKNLWMCSAPGAGSKAKLICQSDDDRGIIQDLTSWNNPTKKADFVFHDLDLEGYYDPLTETMGGDYATTNPGGDVFLSRRFSSHATYTLFHNVDAAGFNTLFTSLKEHNSGNPDNLDLIFNNTSVTKWSNFGVFESEQGFTAYTGVRISQDPLALSGNVKTIGANEHGPIRLQLCGKCVMHSCDFFSRNGWFENTIGIHNPQPTVRWNQAGTPRGKLNMQGCAMEGGVNVLFLAPQDANYPSVINNMLIEKTAIVGGAFTGDPIVVMHSGLTVRNNLFIHAGDRTQLGTFEPSPFVRLDARKNDANYLATPNQVYSNTFVNQVSDAESQGGDASVAAHRLTNNAGSDFSNVAVENNVIHQPNLGAPDVSFAPLSTATLFTPRYADYRDYSIISPQAPLVSNVVDGESVVYSYAKFGAGLTIADFDQIPVNSRHPHQMRIGGSYSAATFVFDTVGVTVTNISGGTWPVGTSALVALTGINVNVRPEYGTPSNSVISATPLAGSAAIGAATSGLNAYDDFYGQQRHPTPTIGAFEVFG